MKELAILILTWSTHPGEFKTMMYTDRAYTAARCAQVAASINSDASAQAHMKARGQIGPTSASCLPADEKLRWALDNAPYEEPAAPAQK